MNLIDLLKILPSLNGDGSIVIEVNQKETAIINIVNKDIQIVIKNDKMLMLLLHSLTFENEKKQGNENSFIDKVKEKKEMLNRLIHCLLNKELSFNIANAKGINILRIGKDVRNTLLYFLGLDNITLDLAYFMNFYKQYRKIAKISTPLSVALKLINLNLFMEYKL